MNIEVVGRHALMFDDDSMAAFVNSGDALVEWSSLQIDRYDVRHLLSGPLPPRRRRSYQPTGDSSFNSEIDHERYLDLPLSSGEAEVEEEVQATEKPGDGSFRAVGFSYGDIDNSANQRNAEEGLECPRFQPPFSVPKSLVHCLPPTEKVHQIIARTATFVIQHGAQSEIVLRVKQGDNPTFGFLMPHHNLHPYFRFLVDHQEVLQSGSDAKPQSGEVDADQKKMDAGGALSLLGSIYGTEEDDDESVLEDAQESRDADSGRINSNSSLDSHVAEKTESSTNAPQKDKVVAKSTLHSKDKPPAVKKNPSMTVSKSGGTGSLKKGDVSGSCSTSSENNDKPLIEPPTDLKILVDKIVDFITNNGKQFETALREQDSKQGRFPFLVPSDQYHPYYLKVLKKSEESKLGVKSSSANMVHLGLNKKGSSYKEESGGSSLYSDLPYESDKKEKFEMTIGKPKKNIQDQQSKATRQEGGIDIDDEVAAAILQAATRCFKNPYAGINSSSSLNGIQQGRDVRQNSGQKSSSSDTKVIAKSDVSETSSQPESDSNLTKEQKLKAERLRRAKMFVSRLKNGVPSSKDEPSRSLSVEPLERKTSVSPAEGNHDNIEGGSNTTLAEISALEKHESSERKMLREENNEKRSRRKYRSRSDLHEDSDEEETEQSIPKHRDERRRYEEEKNHQHSGKKHRSRRSSDYDRDYKKEKSHRHSSKRHRSRGSSREDDDGEISSDSSAHRHSSKKKHSSHRHHKHYEDDDKRSEKHSRKTKHRSHRSSRSSKESPKKRKVHSSGDEASQHGHYEEKNRSASERGHDLEEGEISPKVVDPSKSTNERASSQPSETTPHVSDDLRAKIRAMLLSTM